MAARQEALGGDMTNKAQAYPDVLWHTAFGVAHRILGLPWQAEDVAQSTMERWISKGPDDVRHPEAFIARISANLALNYIRSEARLSRKHDAFGLPIPLPEYSPVPVETRIDLSYALAARLMHLPPLMRAVFVLRSAFDMPFEDISQALDNSSATCRQAHSRAHRRLAALTTNARPISGDQHVLKKLVSLIEAGDEAELAAVLAADIVLESDGGANAPAFGKAINGRDRIAKFLVVSPTIFGGELAASYRRSASGDFVLLHQGKDIRLVVLVEMIGKEIFRIFAISDPDKLAPIRSGH